MIELKQTECELRELETGSVFYFKPPKLCHDYYTQLLVKTPTTAPANRLDKKVIKLEFIEAPDPIDFGSYVALNDKGEVETLEDALKKSDEICKKLRGRPKLRVLKGKDKPT